MSLIKSSYRSVTMEQEKKKDKCVIHCDLISLIPHEQLINSQSHGSWLTIFLIFNFLRIPKLEVLSNLRTPYNLLGASLLFFTETSSPLRGILNLWNVKLQVTSMMRCDEHKKRKRSSSDSCDLSSRMHLYVKKEKCIHGK